MSLFGERLRQTRERRGIAPLQVEMDTRIRAAVIQALEQNDYANLPPEPFLRGLIRTYSAYLGLDSDEMLALYIADRTPPPTRPTRPVPAPPAPPTQPEIAAPVETDASPASLPPAEPVRKPAAIRLPSLRPPIPRPPALKPSPPEPSAPPESLAPPESFIAAPPLDATTEPASRAHLTRRPAPLPVIIAIGVGIICVCLIAGLIALTQFAPIISDLAGMKTNTPTRLAPTRTPTSRPGTLPTAIPTLGATALPFSSLPVNPTATRQATHSASGSFSSLNLDVIQVTQPITLHVGVDGVLVFSGQMAPGTTRSWSARDSLYVQIENPKGATLELNGNDKLFAPRNFTETRILERQWSLNEKGTPIPMSPAAPATPRLTPNLLPRLTPTPTLTPF
ncbi:MAG: DUF4115 domain-containing protein [Anaerolineales bacterium]|nr:DUF4115 domain-containing protein [Anaerolineales bacterium]